MNETDGFRYETSIGGVRHWANSISSNYRGIFLMTFFGIVLRVVYVVA